MWTTTDRVANAPRPPRRAKWRTADQPERDAEGRRIRLRHPPEVKARLVETQDGLCTLCGLPFGVIPDQAADRRRSSWEATIDHVVRFADGGLDGHPNLAAAHEICNRMRDADHPSEPDAKST